ncbi:MAG: AI-2E family transporter [Bacteroidota bacterium]
MNSNKFIISALGIIALTVIVIVLYQLQELLLPFSIAVLLSIMFQPLVIYLKSKNVPIVVSVIIVFLIISLSILIFGAILYSSSESLIADLPKYQEKLNDIINSMVETVKVSSQTLGIKIESIDPGTLFGATTVTADVLSSTLATFIDYIGKSALVLLFMLFMIAGTGDLRAKVIKAYSVNESEKINLALQNIGIQVRRYLIVKMIVNGITGLLTLLALWMLGVDFPLFWGVMAFLFSFIPHVGSVLSIGLPFILSLLQFDSFTIPLLVIVFLLIIFMVMGNLVQPKMMASSLDLSVLLILVALIFWGIVWGPWGMILAIPLTTTIKIIFENIGVLKPLSILMGTNKDE